MPDLGRYAAEVLSSYAAAIGLVVVLVALSLWRNARVRRDLRAVEARQGRNNG